MATSPESMEFILNVLGRSKRFATRRMFGDYALYVDGKVVGFICDNQLYIKIIPESQALETLCDKDEAYLGSKPYYLVEESQLPTIEELPAILFAMSEALPTPKKKVKKKK